ncbi:hypothetical protein JOC34_000430 [Virgibacillus halotolerans]|uniref:phage tail fiber protein n=1 Tax=Virgibacillus halotolerans TaxID=1071053 RepID=UPI00195F9612|nr:hypothetical protein [Virgibacillus halotolerans]MBM7598073.1 hypothetical protein [Virgibacillus halotolerans]
MAFTNFLKNKVLEENFTDRAVDVALFTDVETEVTEDSYERQSIEFQYSKNGEIKNEAEVRFPISEEDYGIVTHIGIYSAEELIDLTELKNTREILSGDQFVIGENGYTISLD